MHNQQAIVEEAIGLLLQQNQELTVARVKRKLRRPVPLAIVMSVVHAAQQEPELYIKSSAEHNKEEAQESRDLSHQELVEHVLALQRRVKDLESKVEQLKNSN